jgi:hypothetical protein
LLAKMTQRISGRRTSWMNSLFKFDHSARTESGERVRTMERMMEDSSVRAPELFPVKKLKELMADKLVGPDGLSINIQDADHAGAQVRDVAAAMLGALDSAEGSTCGGMATAGTAADPHWVNLSMDGANVSRAKTGVRVVLYPGSVEKMNQSVHGIRNISEYQAVSAAEAYETLVARTAHLRPQLLKIYRDKYITRADGTRVYVRLMLTADKSGLAHLLGRCSINHDAFGMQCGCCDSQDELLNLTKPPMTHFDGTTYEIRSARAHVAEWEALGLQEPPDWTVYCDCCKKTYTKAEICAERER